MNEAKKSKPNELLRRQRELRCWTLQEAADKLYDLCFQDNEDCPLISPDQVGRWERGVKPHPKYQAKLCALYGKKPDELGFVTESVPSLIGREQSFEQASFTIHPPMRNDSMPQSVAPLAFLSPHQAVDWLCEYPDAQAEQQLGAWLALGGHDLVYLLENGWTVEKVLEALHIVLQVVQAMPENTRLFSRRQVLGLGAAAVISSIPLPSGNHVSVEAKTRLSQALSESIIAGWNLFHTASNAQVLAVAQAQLLLIQQSHPMLPSKDRSMFYTSVYNLIGKTQQLQERYGDALDAHVNAHIAAMGTGNPLAVVQSLTCQADSYQALGRHTEAIEAIEEALHILGEPSDEMLVRAKAHLLACWADNAMTIGEHTTVEKKLDETAAFVDQISPNEEFDRAAWLQLAGKYAFAVGRYDTAIQHYENALAELPPNWLIRQAFVLVPLMVGYACKRERDISLSVADKAVSVISALNAPVVSKQFADAIKRGLLGAFPNDRQVYQYVASIQHRLPTLNSAAIA